MDRRGLIFIAAAVTLALVLMFYGGLFMHGD